MEIRKWCLDISNNRAPASIKQKKFEGDGNVYRKLQKDIMKRAKSIIDDTFSPTPRVPKIKRSKWKWLINTWKKDDELPLTIQNKKIQSKGEL